MRDPQHLEGIAAEAWEAAECPLPVDALELAEALGFGVQGWPKGHGAIQGRTIRYPVNARLVRQHGTVGHELGHALAAYHGLDPCCEGTARYLAGALMLPRRPFTRDLSVTDWDLFALQRLHPNASAEMIVVRMTQVSPACAWVWDAGKLARSYGPVTGPESAELVDQVLTIEKPVFDGLMKAWPVFDGRWRRVLVVRRAA